MNIGKLIYNRRKVLNLTLEEIGTAVGVSKSTVQKWENGFISNMKRDKIAALAKVLHISPVALIIGEDYNGDNDDVTTSIPILGNVAAGNGAYADNNVIGYMDVSNKWMSPCADYVVLHVVGDSMYPEIQQNDHALIKCQSSVDSGSYAVAIIDDEAGVIKRIIYDKNFIELQSVNPMYPPRRFEDEDVQRVRIFGLVKKVIRSYK